jgi:hypothetical protein
VLDNPLSMPCGHNFCKGCLDKRYAEAEAAKAGNSSKALAEAQPVRSMRVRKVRECRVVGECRRYHLDVWVVIG